MKHSDSIAALAAALAKAQGQLEGAKKDSTNPHFKSKYADLSSVVEALKACVPANGLSYVQTVVTSDHGVGVETMLMHSSGEWICGEPFTIPVNKADAQGFGSALTYSRRYSLSAMAGVKADDDDGNAAAAAPADTAGRLLAANINGAQISKDVLSSMSAEEQDFIRSVAADVQKQGDNMHHWLEAQNLDTEEKMALWSLLPSNVRSAIKKQAPKPQLVSQA